MTKHKKITKKFLIYLWIISILLFLFTVINTFIIIKFDVLPFKYLIIYMLIFTIIPLFIIWEIINKKHKRNFKTLMSVFSIIYIILLGFISHYLNSTYNFLDEFTTHYNYETKHYYILVSSKSKYKDIKELNNKDIAYVNDNNKKLINEKLNKKVNINYKNYEYYNECFDSLKNNEVDGILILDSYYLMLQEEDNKIKDNTKILYEFDIVVKTRSIKKDVNVTKDPFAIYISGIDSYGDVTSRTRSDVNILAVVNPTNHQVLMINIPRDYYVTLNGINEKDKLTHAGLYGIETSVKTLEDLLDIDINYYVKVNYNALIDLVDALDGVSVYSEYDFRSYEYHYHFKKGYNEVNGKKALDFVRTRKAFKNGDRVRGENQERMIEAIINKVSKSTILLTKYDSIMKSLKGSFTTNISTDKITDLVKYQIDKMPKWNVTSISLNGSDGEAETYSYKNQKLYVMIPDANTIISAKENIKKVINS